MRTRVASLLAVGVLVVVAAIVLRPKSSATAPGNRSGPARVQPPSGPTGSAAVPDSERVAALATWGMLLGGGDEATFYEATMKDSSVAPEELGFMRASSLVDGKLAIELHGARAAPSVAHLRAPLTADSVVRALRAEGCTEGPAVQLRRDTPAEQPWEVGLIAGAATPVPLEPIADSVAMAAEARRLSASIPSDTASRSEGVQPAATLFRGVPFTVPAMYSFVDGATQIVVAVTRREAMSHAAGADSMPIIEHTMLIGERPVGSRVPLVLAWQSRDVHDEDQLTTLTPTTVIRLGREHRVTILVDAKFLDGGGATFLQRVAPGSWRDIAGSYWGC